MAQGTLNIINQGFPSFRADLNDQLEAIATNSSGATAPTTTYPHQWWLDTSTTPNTLRQRNEANNAWVVVGLVDQSNNTFINVNKTEAAAGTAAAPTYTFAGDTNTGVFSPAADTVAVSTNGTERVIIDGNNEIFLPAAIQTGLNASTEDTNIELGGLRSGNGNSFIDFHAQAGVDFNARILRVLGANGNFEIENTGTGAIAFRNSGAERMRIDSAGNVGIGTSSPSGILDLQTNDNTWLNIDATNASVLNFTGTNNSNPAIGYVKDLRFGSITGKNAAGFTERMRITSAGNVGIGTSSPADTLDVNGEIGVRGTGVRYPTVASTFSRGANSIAFTWTSPNIYGVVDNVTEMVVGTASDYRLKENDEPLADGLQTVMSLRPVTYNPVDFAGTVNTDKIELGLIAHEVQAIRPSVVTGKKDAVGEDGKPRYQSVNYAGLVPDLIKAIQEQQAIIEDLKSEVAALKGTQS